MRSKSISSSSFGHETRRYRSRLWREPVQPSAGGGSSRTAGRGRQDVGRWGPMTRTAPFNSAGAAELAYRPRASHRHDA